MSLRHLPNAISIGRLFLLVPLVLSMLAGRFEISLVLFALAGASDFFDGMLARNFGWQSKLGAVLDPAADKAFIVVSFVTLAWLGMIPLWLVAFVFARDILIVLFWAGIYAFRVGDATPIPSILSKINTAAQTVCLIIVVFAAAYAMPRAVVELWFVITLLTTVLSGLHYLFVYSQRLVRLRHTAH